LRLAHLPRDLKDLGKVLQAGGADAVGPFLVFLDLLERQPKGVAEIGLAHIEHEPSHAHAAANMLVDRIDNAPRHRPSPHEMASVPTVRLRRTVVLLLRAKKLFARAI
jgi:hypothetical protein